MRAPGRLASGSGQRRLPNRAAGSLLPERAWVEEFLHSLVFPSGAHDDDVDASRSRARCVQRRL